MLVQPLGPEIAAERLDARIAGRFAGQGKVQHHILLASPQIEVSGDELAAIVQPDYRGYPTSSQTRSSV